jgi:serine/threonine protein kinase
MANNNNHLSTFHTNSSISSTGGGTSNMQSVLDEFEHPDFLDVKGFLGKGSFGVVVLMEENDKNTNNSNSKRKRHQQYALKRVLDYSSMPGNISTHYALKICREVATLSMLQKGTHQNNNNNNNNYIVPLYATYLSSDKRDVYLLMPYIGRDLQNLVENARPDELTEGPIKWISYQILAGIKSVHARKLMHRDLTLKNILVDDQSGNLDTYIADFGLARANVTAGEDITLDVVTIEYRSPELLMQYENYDSRVDMWSIGCMIAEMYLRRRLFTPKFRDIPNAIIKVLQVLGRQDDDFVKEHAPRAYDFFSALQKKFDSETAKGKHCYEPSLESQLTARGASDEAIAVITGLLQFDFRKRLTADQALQMDWFKKDEKYADFLANLFPSKQQQEHNNDNDDDDDDEMQQEQELQFAKFTRIEETGEILEANPELRNLQKMNLEQLREWMEAKVDKFEHIVKGRYSSTLNNHNNTTFNSVATSPHSTAGARSSLNASVNVIPPAVAAPPLERVVTTGAQLGEENKNTSTNFMEGQEISGLSDSGFIVDGK